MSGKRDITLIAALLILLAVIVISGMITSVDRQTDRGEVQKSVFVAQEGIGGATLAALGLTALGLPRYARGQRAAWTYTWLAIDALLGVLWFVAWVNQFAS